MERPSLDVRADGKKAFVAETAMYDELETNIAHQWMSFSDKPFSPRNQLYPPRQLVSGYLDEYAEDIRHLIKLHTQIMNIRLERSSRDLWHVRTKNLMTFEESTQVYDAIAVCSGHYTVPFTPEVPGMKLWNEQRPGSITHSKYFRRQDSYAGKKVIVVGSSMSALDISAHIKLVSETPVLISHRTPTFWTDPENRSPDLRVVPEIAEFLCPKDGRWTVRFTDGSFEEDVDRVLYCTGYLYTLPFLSPLERPLITDGFRVRNTYQHIFNIDHQSLSFLLLPLRVQPFPLAEVQAAVIARAWSGRLTLPSADAMRAWEAARVAATGDGKSFHLLPYPQDYDYHNMLYDWAAEAGADVGKMGARRSASDYWYRERMMALRFAFTGRGEARREVRTVQDMGFDYEAWRAEQRENGDSD